jgi:hypothetical protein
VSTPPNKTSWKPLAVVGSIVLGCGCLTLLIVGLFGVAAWRRHRHDLARAEQQDAPSIPPPMSVRDRVAEILDAQSFATISQPDGIAVAVLIDTSGSMKEKVRDADGSKRRKLDIAERSVAQLVERAERASRERPEVPLVVGVYEFSVRSDSQRCRVVVPFGHPDRGEVERALASLRPEGDTPIGDALISARRDLAATGFAHQHVLVVTDGENTKGYAPADVVGALSRLPDDRRVSTYLVAFDVDAKVFDAVEEAGALVLPAAGGSELEQSLDYVLTGKILAEQPLAPSERSGELR